MTHKFSDESIEYAFDDMSEDQSVYIKAEYEDYDGSSFSVTSDYKKRLKELEDIKRLDKGYNKIKRKVDGKSFSVEFYATSYSPGFRIRNAMTGIYEDGMLVGSRDEDLFFVVVLATGETGQTPPHLYYDTPEQYERHFRCTIPTSTKERWYEKHLKERQRRSILADREERLRSQRNATIVK